MPTMSLQSRIVMIAMVVQERDGLMMIGSNNVLNGEVSMMHYEEWGREPSEITIQATCRSAFIRRSEPMATMPHLSQRGIYLPDMSFRVLPAPEDKE
jgi:hypothetical protein